ncbi:MAG: hypothetical protein LBM06_07290 [Prevotellaceae bacterium]|jgi:hypothetical protein|nr:hypothetical protein [Prevotellaceae bacterium]
MNTTEIEFPKLKQGADATPCRYSLHELEKRLDESLKSFQEKSFCTSNELRKRHPRCK